MSMIRACSLQLFCVLALACVTSAGNSGWNSYLLLPLSANLRFFVFVTVFSLFVAVLFIAVFTARLTEAFPLDWSLAVSPYRCPRTGEPVLLTSYR